MAAPFAWFAIMMIMPSTCLPQHIIQRNACSSISMWSVVCVQSESLFKQIVKTLVDQWRELRMLKLQNITERPDLWAHSDFKSARDTALRTLRSRLAAR